MNNIEILEHFCEMEDYEYKEEFIQAIENLIQENKELKERNKKLEYAMDNDLGNIINLGILLSENAEKPKDINIYVDECQAFLNTLNYYYIPKSKVKEKIEILEKCTTKIDKKVNLTDYMIIGETERAVGRFVNLDFIKKVLLDEPGYNIELLEEGK